MTNNQFKKIINETISEYFAEMENYKNPEMEATHEIDGDTVFINDLSVPGLPPLNITVELTLESQQDGFSYDVPFGNASNNYDYPLQHNIRGWKIYKILDVATGNDVKLNNLIKRSVDAYMEEYLPQFEDYINENPPY